MGFSSERCNTLLHKTWRITPKPSASAPGSVKKIASHDCRHPRSLNSQPKTPAELAFHLVERALLRTLLTGKPYVQFFQRIGVQARKCWLTCADRYLSCLNGVFERAHHQHRPSRFRVRS